MEQKEDLLLHLHLLSIYRFFLIFRDSLQLMHHKKLSISKYLMQVVSILGFQALLFCKVYISFEYLVFKDMFP